jgi:hypothetical protein
MAYEVFNRTVTRAGGPALSIGHGRINANAAAVRLLRAAAVRHVLLLWDKDKCRLGIKGTRKEDRNAYAVSFATDNHYGGIRAKSFLRYIGWGTQRQTLPAIWNEEEKMLEVDLPADHMTPKERPKPKLKG